MNWSDFLQTQLGNELDARRQAVYSKPIDATTGSVGGQVLQDGQPQPYVDPAAAVPKSGFMTALKNPWVAGGLLVLAGLAAYKLVK